MVIIALCGSIIDLVACSSMAGEGRSRGRGKVPFDELDKNYDGKITLKEIKSLPAKRRSPEDILE